MSDKEVKDSVERKWYVVRAISGKEKSKGST